jgi:hypothetical protein
MQIVAEIARHIGLIPVSEKAQLEKLLSRSGRRGDLGLGLLALPLVEQIRRRISFAKASGRRPIVVPHDQVHCHAIALQGVSGGRSPKGVRTAAARRLSTRAILALMTFPEFQNYGIHWHRVFQNHFHGLSPISKASHLKKYPAFSFRAPSLSR